MADDRCAQTSEAVYCFLAARDRGENVDVESFCGQHPGLLPELRVAIESGLRRLQTIKDARRAAIPSDGRGDELEGPRRVRIHGYRIIRVIKAGAQGTVYEAIQESTGRTVAVKVVAGITKHSAPRFEREADVLARLRHPGIVSIIDRGRTSDDAYFLALEFVKGQDLDEWIRQAPAGKDGQRQIVRMFVSIARAIDAAHQNGIVHRDLKPSNIMIDEHQQPRILDFGLAQLVSESQGTWSREITLTGNIVGSIPWSSPEQASAKSDLIAPATDVYALGVLLYHALTGSFPYPVQGPLFQVTQNICKKTPRNPSEYSRGNFGHVDRTLSHILLKCLAKQPMDRFASGAELADALDGYLAGTFRAPRRFHKRVVVTTVLVLAIAAIATEYQMFFTDPTIPVQEMPTFVNSVGMKFVKLRGGSFRMGSSLGELGHNTSEQSHVVTISEGFYIAQTETTRGEYLRVMGVLPKSVPQDNLDLPVDYVSRDDAQAFCKKLSELDHHNYQLPTEAEWEYACRGGIMLPTLGQDLNKVGWFKGNSGGQLHPVAQKLANHWGIYDMRGNVSEMVLDKYVISLGYDDVRDPLESSEESLFVVRGGNVADSSVDCRPAARNAGFADDARADVGFRVIFR